MIATITGNDSISFNGAIIMLNGKQYRMRVTENGNVYEIQKIETLRSIRYDLPA